MILLEKFIIINFFPLCFLFVTIILANIGGLLFIVAAIISSFIGLMLSFSYKKKKKLFNIAKYFILKNRSFNNISGHFFDNPCSKIIIIYIIYKYEDKCNVLEKYNLLKNHYNTQSILSWNLVYLY